MDPERKSVPQPRYLRAGWEGDSLPPSRVEMEHTRIALAGRVFPGGGVRVPSRHEAGLGRVGGRHPGSGTIRLSEEAGLLQKI